MAHSLHANSALHWYTAAKASARLVNQIYATGGGQSSRKCGFSKWNVLVCLQKQRRVGDWVEGLRDWRMEFVKNLNLYSYRLELFVSQCNCSL